MNSSLVIPNFLEEIYTFPLYCFPLFLCIDHWGRFSYPSLLFFGTPSIFKLIDHSFPPLLFASLLFTAVCMVSSDSHFAFSHFFFLGMVLITASCTMLQTWPKSKPLWLYSGSDKKIEGIRSDRQSAWWTMDRGLWHCTGDRDQDHPHGKEMQKSKMAVWGGLTNNCEQKRSKKQRRKGMIYQFEYRRSSKE